MISVTFVSPPTVALLSFHYRPADPLPSKPYVDSVSVD